MHPIYVCTKIQRTKEHRKLNFDGWLLQHCTLKAMGKWLWENIQIFHATYFSCLVGNFISGMCSIEFVCSILGVPRVLGTYWWITQLRCVSRRTVLDVAPISLLLSMPLYRGLGPILFFAVGVFFSMGQALQLFALEEWCARDTAVGKPHVAGQCGTCTSEPALSCSILRALHVVICTRALFKSMPTSGEPGKSFNIPRYQISD